MVNSTSGYFKDFDRHPWHLDGTDPSKSTATIDVTMESIEMGLLRTVTATYSFVSRIDEFPNDDLRLHQGGGPRWL